MIKVLWWNLQQWLGTFTMVLVEGSSEMGIFEHYLTRFSEPVISEIQKLWWSFFFSKCSKLNLNFKNAAKKLRKCSVFKILAPKLVSLNFLYKDKDTFHGQPMCWKTVPRFFMWITQIFSNTISLPLSDEYDQRVAMHMSTLLGHVYHIACRCILSNGTF